MTNKQSTPSSGLRIVAAIGEEFDRVVEDHRDLALGGRPSPGRGGRLLAACLAGCLLLGVGAGGAATGILPVGSIIPGGQDPENKFEHGSDEQTIVARGVAPVAGPWRLTALRTKGNPDTGEPPGDCLELLLTDPPPGSPIGATLLCQNVGKSEFKADSIPVIDTSSGAAELLLFGSVPEPASSVELTADVGAPRRAETYQAPPGFGAGRPWVMIASAGQEASRLWSINPNGSRRAELDASTYLEQLAIWQRSKRRN